MSSNQTHLTKTNSLSLSFFLSHKIITCLPQIPFCKKSPSSSLSSQNNIIFHRSYVGFLGVFSFFLVVVVVSVRVSHRENRKARKKERTFFLSLLLFLLLFLSSLSLFLLSSLSFLSPSLSHLSLYFLLCDHFFFLQ